ncbi:MAG: PTS sugar transporter subunit IIC [Enterococcus lacertideformus]|uniref:PTS sugar transporter subunit IIC n=1 Tax=Enterococcus lacertideformus TaxID=2771493 RepID=A0A931F827_9ENTE|nr:PTS sugar transporter subunit IIC [Enterococcus lacertideformus]
MGNSTIITKLNDILSPIAAKIGNQRHLKAISSGMMFGLPFIVIGSFFLIFANPPINLDQYHPETANFFMKFMASWKEFAVANYDLITAPYNLTMGIIGLISVFGIAFSLANEYKINPAMNGMVATVVFLMISTPVKEGMINLNYLGTNGLFVAIIIGLLVVEINRLFEVKNIKLKLPDTVPPMVATFINTLVPLLMNLQMFRISVLGGAGGTLGLVILMMRSKVSEYRAIGKLSIIPGICSINEPIIFGLPIVFNPILAIPFLITPIISLLLTYFAQKVGLIGIGFIVDPSFTPFFAQAYLSSMDWRNIVFCLLLICISVIIYYPFFKVMENNKTKLVDEEL